ncbi:MAG: hypothetical protein AB2L20_12790 [Mangrovibacterium sp.]
MKIFQVILFIFFIVGCSSVSTQSDFQSNYFKIHIDGKGFITSMKNITSKPAREFSPSDKPSPVMCIYDGNKKVYYKPVSASYNKSQKVLNLTFSNRSVAKISIVPKGKYIKFTLLSLEPRVGIEDVQWGLYHTSITNLMGEIIGVARDTSEAVNYAIGVLALNDNTIGGTSETVGDAAPGGYVIHSPNPKLFPIPDNLKEGQIFPIGGDGRDDIAFYAHKEPYYRYLGGNTAHVDSLGQISISYHSRDRQYERELYLSLLPNTPANAPNHMAVEAIPGVDYIGSSIALWGSPDSTALLDVIQNIVVNEGLPYLKVNGKWVKDPASFVSDVLVYGEGPNDSIISYTSRLGFNSIIFQNLSFLRPDRGNHGYIDGKNFDIKPIKMSSGNLTHLEFSEMAAKKGISIGRCTITTSLAPGTKDASPVPSDSLSYQHKRLLTNNIGANDTIIEVNDPKYLEEIASFEGHCPELNIVKIGKELIHYMGVSGQEPFRLLKVKRGYWNTVKSNHHVGDTIFKLQVPVSGAYTGLIPNMVLQDEIAKHYADVSKINGLTRIDFDGQEFLTQSGHGYYSEKRFFHLMFDKAAKLGVPYLRISGACLTEGSWHYHSVWNVGGGTNMYDVNTREWGSSTSQGKDLRDMTYSNYFPVTMGANFPVTEKSTAEQYEHIQAIAVGVGATYNLYLNQKDVESCPQKDAIFKVIRTWEDARAANAFPEWVKKQLVDPTKDWKLEVGNEKNTWKLYQVTNGIKSKPVILKRSPKKI